ncbi:hypothetical protein ABEF95_011519 [Exophiala dermatitidis]
MQATNTTVCIFVIAEDQEHPVRLANTLSDTALPKSMISKAKALATRGLICPLNSPSTFTDRIGTTYTSASTISLRWYYDDGLKTFRETFYIVDKLPRAAASVEARAGAAALEAGYGGGGDWDAILRTGVEPNPTIGQAYPYCTIPAGRDPQREAQARERLERGQKQFQAQKEEQQKKVRESLAKGSKMNTKR